MNMEQEPGEGQAPMQVQRALGGRESMETWVIIGVMVAYLVLVVVLFVLINLVVDLIYGQLDPRIRIKAAL